MRELQIFVTFGRIGTGPESTFRGSNYACAAAADFFLVDAFFFYFFLVDAFFFRVKKFPALCSNPSSLSLSLLRISRVARWFQTKNPNLDKILEGHRKKNVIYIFDGHLEYFTDVEDILCPFGSFCVDLVHFSGFGSMNQEKSGNPALNASVVGWRGSVTRNALKKNVKMFRKRLGR
jgi:hypothetical protein